LAAVRLSQVDPNYSFALIAERSMDSMSVELKHASEAGDLVEVCRLIDAGADPNSTDEHGSGTLLCFHPPIVAYLLSHGANPNIQTNENGASVLAGLAYMNQLECVRLLLEHGADANRGRSASGETPLHHALAKDESDRGPLVKVLLDHGADPNAKTNPGVISYNFWRDARTRGETPLHRAAAYAPSATIDLLLGAGADPAVCDANGDTPRAWASWHLRDWSTIERLDPTANGHGMS
jgi:ankyrin repeat protein